MATAAAATDPRRLYREIVEIEKQLRELIRSNPLNAQDANVLRGRLVDRARVLAQSHPTFAAQRELEQVLWKPCFYKRIEDFRRRIRKYAAAPPNDRNVREHFARVSAEFQDFLRDAAMFYDNLREYFTKWLLANRVSRIAGAGAVNGGQPDTQASNIDKCRTSLHRCLVFLGDLARYRELHSQKAKKNFVAAEGFYHKALAVIPENGNPHNQLAVLATYVEAETVAVYRYCRSLLIAQPFATAEENLALLFERSRQRPQAPPSSAVITAESNAKDKAAYLKSFLHRLTRMHGLLFSIATRQSAPSGGLPSNAPVYSKEMESLLMKDLLALLGTGVVGDALLVKLVVTNVFCIVKATGTAALDDALRLALRMVSVVVEFLQTQLPTIRENGGPLPNYVRLAGAVSTFCDFLRCNPKVLEEVDAMGNRNDDADLSKRFATEFLESLVKLLNHAKLQAVVHAASGENERVLMEQQLQLKENVELRGFKPLSALIDAGSANKWRDDLAVSAGLNPGQPSTGQASPSDRDAWKLRAWNIHRFAKFVCDEYEGNPLLYFYKGQFSTKPSVVSGISNGFGSGISGLITTPSVGLGLFRTGGPLASPPVPQPVNKGAASASSTAEDDFDDEIIVYQPSPALAPSLPPGEGSSALGGASNSILGNSLTPLGSPFGLEGPFSLDSSPSVFGNGSPQQPAQPAQQRLSLSSPNSLFGSFGQNSNNNNSSGSDSGAIGSSSLGYGGFNAFGGLGSFSGQTAFSGQGFLSTGWGNVATQGAAAKSPVTSLSGAFAADSPKPPQAQPSASSTPFRGSLFGDMDDLAAVERESAMYQQKESSLSAFLRPSASHSSLSTAGGTPPLPTRSASVGGSRPPPGFAAAASPPGFARSSTGASNGETGGRPPQPPPQFFTRNPFANP